MNTTTAGSTSSSTSTSSGFNIENIKLYYDRLFPFNLLFQWLTYSHPPKFQCREFSMSMARDDSDFYIRWQSFQNEKDFKAKVLSMSPPPHKMDIGGIYNVPVSLKATTSQVFTAVEKEIVFDIDMNDYDDIRTCCKGKKVCQKCWRFLTIAMELLERSLREEFGFRHIFWVFSGRRGVHCWICDRKARRFSSYYRAALADYLNVISGAANQKKKVHLFGDEVDPTIRRAFESQGEAFKQLLREQDFFRQDSQLEKTVDHYINEARPNKIKPDQTPMKGEYEVFKQFDWDGTSIQLWEKIISLCATYKDNTTPIELMLTFCYPRLDINVTKDMGHLLKSPFCVHQATGSICVPLRPEEKANFDPVNAPTLNKVKEQFVKHQSVDKTDLGPYIRYFEYDVLRSLLNDDKEEAAAESKEETAARREDYHDAIKGKLGPEARTGCTALEW